MFPSHDRVGLSDEDDVKWYRRHVVKSSATLEWLQDQRGCCYQIHDVGEEPISKEFNVEIIGPLFKNISELDRRILTLRYAEQMKWQMISDLLGYNLSYLWKREKRAMEKLRAIIDRDNLSPWRNNEEN